jgi:hypothetical protein
MFQKIAIAFSAFKNIDKLKDVLNTSYVAIVKTLETLAFVQSELNNIQIDQSLKDYIPKTIDILTKIKELIEKYGPFIGFVPPTVTPSSATLLTHLDITANKLDEHLV